MARRSASLATIILVLLALAPVFPSTRLTSGSTAAAAAVELPLRLSDQEFWRLSSTFSEPGGTFHSDNFVSNEGRFQTIIPDLVRRARQGGFYVGVGPEQNFTYMTALRPSMAFILDIRRGNLQEHLLYKALFEMSTDRAEFVGRLFSRQRPAGLGPASSVDQIFDAYGRVRPTESGYRANLKAVTDWLTKRHALPLSTEDLAGIDYIYRTAFFTDGPDLNYRLNGQQGRGGIGRGGGGTPSYEVLMTMDDGTGRQRSYLASEPSFAYLKDLESKNLVVPVVGDFGGPKALRAIGRYAREHGATVAAYYLSNVEQYLRQDDKWDAFCANVASMPLDASSTFIRSIRGGGAGRGAMFTSYVANMQTDIKACAVPVRGRAAR